jgi:adenine C2-methylase RlmN of 23S rRNA A2503 and tRNA A37
MKGIELAKSFATKSWSGLARRLSRQKSKWRSAFSISLAAARDFQDKTLFYVLPVKKRIQVIFKS